jgi:hypothetical protein
MGTLTIESGTTTTVALARARTQFTVSELDGATPAFGPLTTGGNQGWAMSTMTAVSNVVDITITTVSPAAAGSGVTKAEAMNVVGDTITLGIIGNADGAGYQVIAHK